MKKYFEKGASYALLVWASVLMGSVSGMEVIVPPEGGEDLVSFSEGDSVRMRKKEKADKVSQNWVAAEEMPFSKSLQVDLRTKPKDASGLQLIVPLTQPCQKGDSLLLSFWVRRPKSAGEPGPATIYLQEGAEKERYEFKFSPFREWEQHVRPFPAPDSFSENGAIVCIHVGGAGPVIEVADLRLVNYGAERELSDLPRSKVTYKGREPDATWRKEALERIDRIRKAELVVEVIDAEGQPVPDAEVHVEMQRHAFRFGNTVDSYILGAQEKDFPYTKTRQGQAYVTTWEDVQRYREVVKTYFNAVTFESELRPHSWKRQTGGKSPNVEAYRLLRETTIPWLQENDIDIRGHYLSWGAMDFNAIEAVYVGNPEGHRKWLWAHLADILPKTEGVVTEWDTINHIVAWGNHTYEKEYGGLEILGEIMAEARRLAPNATHAINEGKVLPDGYKREPYKRVIRALNEQGQAPDTVGFMAHFGLTSLTPPEELLAIYDDFAKIAPSLQLSEFDVEAGDDEELQADYYRDVLLATFSHPNFHSIVQWGFWANAHWKPYAALWREDWTLKPAGEVFVDLVTNQWWTDETIQSDAKGQGQVRGFLGDYQVRVTHEGRTAVGEVTLDRDGSKVSVSLPRE